MKEKFKKYYMKIALETSELSYCERKKVGAILVKNDSIISMGYNGTLPGLPNVCESDDNVTLPWVVHAEENCIAKVAKSTNSTMESHMFVTMQPCVSCTKLIVSAGVKNVYYHEGYRDKTGVDLLEECGIIVEQVEL